MDEEKKEISEELRPEEKQPRTFKDWLKYLIYLVLIPLLVVGGIIVFKEKMYGWLAVVVLILSMIPFFLVFEKKTMNVYRLVLLSVLVAISVFGRFAFIFIPFFKPVSAIVIICGTYMGAECGFLCGALSALLSNFYFGQGPWTPFQMLAWGLIGLFAAMLSKVFLKHKWTWLIYGAIAGIFYSMALDVWTLLVTDGTFELSRYFTYVVAALPMTGIYMLSNVVFLLIVGIPIGKKLERIKIKYGL